MIFAMISDIHGNLESLTAVMEDIRRNTAADEVLFLGDAVGYGASPNEVVHIINAECSVKIMGNHDYSALGLLDPTEFNVFAQSAINYSASVLTDESREILKSFRMSDRTRGMLLVHATPLEPDCWHYCLSTSEAARQFEALTERLCFIGHSHQPVIFRQNRTGDVERISAVDTRLNHECRHLINVGAVGQPRDGDPRACYVTYDSVTLRLQYRRVEYDVAAAQAKMRHADLPIFLIERLATGR